MEQADEHHLERGWWWIREEACGGLGKRRVVEVGWRQRVVEAACSGCGLDIDESYGVVELSESYVWCR